MDLGRIRGVVNWKVEMSRMAPSAPRAVCRSNSTL